ncbi:MULTISPECIES: phosphonate ABC transporter, permease protein PhnE [Brevibacterium]|uniref:Phosphonate ABC transporter, permease protein PhnE n=1 Tax=Brevibacterium salitolerans TaxID=1403566 RepID=A0ABN2WDZ6_9MICO|nr:phosphonate ABC transporter, permease protein PhnE [Brevibacterium sp.]
MSRTAEQTRTRRPVPPASGGRGRTTAVTVVVVALVVAHVVAVRETEFSLAALFEGREGMARFLSEAFPPDLSWSETVRPALEATGITLWIGLLGTTFSIPTSALLAVWGSRTTAPNAVVYQVSRAIMSFFRAVPDIVFALIFVTAVGLGPFAGVLALICHNTGVMGKLWSESIEEIDPGPSEALRTAGGSRAQIVANATFPQVSASLLGLLLYRFDVNVRSSLVLGLVGAGGIGLLINQSIKSFQFDAMLTQIIVVLVLVIVVDLFSAAVRRRLAL